MISLICFLLTLAGSINWFCIGVLQYDFVAGLFGSQANVFSRIIYALIGLSSIWLVFATIKGKGKLKIDGKRSTDKQLLSTKKSLASSETSPAYNPNNNTNNTNSNNNYQQDNRPLYDQRTTSSNSFNGFNNEPYDLSQDYHDYRYESRRPYHHDDEYPPQH